MSVDLILNATSWTAILPKDKTEARKEYRKLAHTVHPDACDDPRAAEAFRKLRSFYTAAMTGVVTNEDKATGTTVITVYTDGITQLVKIADRFFWTTNHPKDSDLIKGASNVLQILSKSEAKQFYPQFKTTMKDRHNRTLYEVTYPHGVWRLGTWEHMDDRTIVWVFKRLLVALMVSHKEGYVHGNVCKDNIVILPSDHGLLLDNWAYSVRIGENLKIKGKADIPDQYISKKEPAEAWVDIQAAAKVMLDLAEPTMDKRLSKWFSGVAKYEENDGALLLREFEELVIEVFGPPQWHPLDDPSVPAMNA